MPRGLWLERRAPALNWVASRLLPWFHVDLWQAGYFVPYRYNVVRVVELKYPEQCTITTSLFSLHHLPTDRCLPTAAYRSHIAAYRPLPTDRLVRRNRPHHRLTRFTTHPTRLLAHASHRDY